jgi:hypothetical protein
MKKDLYYSTKLAIWQNIYSGGRVKTTKKLAELNIDKVICEGKLIRSNVVNKVKLAFNECLYHKELLKYYNSKIAKASKKELSDFKRKILVEQFHYEKEVLNLLNAIGIELNSIISIPDSLSPKIKDIDLNKCLLLFYQFKSDIKAAQQQEGLDELMLSLFYSQRYPNVSIGAVQEWFGEKIINDKSNWHVFLNLDFPIFDGGSTFARLKQGKIKFRESTIKRAKAESEMKLEVSKAFMEYGFWRKQAINMRLLEKTGHYNETDINIIYNLNKSYYNNLWRYREICSISNWIIAKLLIKLTKKVYSEDHFSDEDKIYKAL